MDWLEVPNLRARGIAWVIARLRRRPPRFGDLDREGRLVALYGMLAVAWLAIAANLAYRIYADRVAGLAIGLWRAGWPARILLAAVVVGLAAPLVWLVASWLGKRWRRLRDRLAERRFDRDAPRRLTALRASALGRLPTPALAELAAQSRWARPRTGEQLVFAGAAQPNVYVVVDGALEARRPGDPTGTVRERVGAGGVVGLGNALTGAPAALAWHTAGTTLLAVPSSAVAGAVGPLGGPPPVERAELEDLLGTTPALAALSTEDRLGLATRAQPYHVQPGAPIHLAGPLDAIVIASGVLALPEGVELRRGAMVGPYGNVDPGVVATARTPARIWVLPAVAGLPLLIGADATRMVKGAVAPAFGAHPPMDYPPLAAPPGPPPSGVDDRVDRRFERKLWWLLILLLLFALLLTGSNLFSGPVWAEMPSDRALLAVSRGQVTARVDGVDHVLGRNGQIYVHNGDVVTVADKSTANLTFRGGSATVLCAGASLGVGTLVSDKNQPIQPRATLDLRAGRLLVDTQGTSPAFKPLALNVGDVANDGVARFAVADRSAQVRSGKVSLAGQVLLPDPDADLRCGDGVALPKPGESPSLEPSPSEAPPSVLPSPSLSPTPSPTPSLTPGASPTPRRTPTPTPTRTPTRGPTTGPPPPPPTTSPPPPPTKPVLQRGSASPATVAQLNNNEPCSNFGTTVTVGVLVTEDGYTAGQFKVSGSYTVPGGKTHSFRLTLNGTRWTGSFPSPSAAEAQDRGGSMPITVTATDPKGASASLSLSVTLDACVVKN